MMKTALVLALAAVVALGGCAKQNKVTVDSAFAPPASAPAAGMVGAELPPPPAGQPVPAYMPPPAAPSYAPVPAAPAAAAAAPTGGKTHVVKQGESLWKISGEYYGKPSQAGVAKIMKANPGIGNANAIKAGQKLVIPD